MEPARLKDIAEVIGAAWRAGGHSADAIVREVSTDTRTLSGPALFFALRGERFDGHAFVEEARRRGAAASVVALERVAELPESAGPYLCVPDPLDALERLASWNRGRYGLRVAAVTGSVGKTTTKEFLAEILSASFRVRAAPKSFNNRIGVAMTLLQAERATEVVVAELGASAPGEISRLTRIARPNCAVLTEIAPAHLEGFGSLDGVVRAKSEIFEGLDASGTGFIRQGVYGFERLKAAVPGRVLTFGWEAGDYAVSECRRESLAGGPQPSGSGALPREGWAFELRSPRGSSGRLFLPVPGKHNVLNAAAAAAVAREFGMPWGAIREALVRCRLPPSRLAVAEAGGVELVDDSYNANPASMAAAIEEWLSRPDGSSGIPRRLVAVLGEMLELGPESRRLHEELGDRIASAPLGLVVTVGAGARWIGERCLARGAKFRAAHFDSAEEALEFLRREVKRGDRVLLKGSRRVGLDAVASELRNLLSHAPGGSL